MSGLIFLIAAMAAFLVLFIFYPRQRKVGVLNEAYSVDTTRAMHELDPNSLEYKLLASGLGWKPVTFRTFSIGGAFTAFMIASLLLGSIVGLVLAGVVYYAANAWLDDKVKSRGKAIDQHLPIAVGRIAAGLLAGGSPPEVLNAVAASLELEGKSPLTPELYLTAAEMRTKDRRAALVALAERSPSVSLSNLATLLIGYVEAGGEKYAGTLMDISARVQQILSARNRAQAKAGDVMVSTVILPAMLVLVVGYLSNDPMIAHSLRSGVVQMVMAGTVLAMVAGYFILRSMVQEAV
jgi:Flp pilus assembly protein TadB